MGRNDRSNRLIVASHNPGKVVEIADLLKPYGIDPVGAAELGLDEPEETGKTFAENAILKARLAADAAGLAALADDSGLCVDALGGDPGIYSARWAGPDKDFAEAMRKIHELLVELGATEPQQRRGKFVCALALAEPDAGPVEIYEGVVSGTIIWPPRGDKGFGYDPFFQADGHTITFGEMDPDAKHAISHRARAFEQLKQRLSKR